MLMSVIDNSLNNARYGELAGARVMISGLSPLAGVDIARAFADHKARLALQTCDPSEPETTALVAMLAESAHEIELFEAPLGTVEEARRLAQAASRSFGGLDVAINIVTVDARELTGITSMEDIESLASRKLGPLLEATRVVANRMRVVLTEGLILNIVILTGPVSSGTSLIAGYLRSALAAMTRLEAESAAPYGIRVNAIGPRASLPGERPAMSLASEPEMAAVALYLASKRARKLSGHVFDAEGALTRNG